MLQGGGTKKREQIACSQGGTIKPTIYILGEKKKSFRRVDQYKGKQRVGTWDRQRGKGI